MRDHFALFCATTVLLAGCGTMTQGHAYPHGAIIAVPIQDVTAKRDSIGKPFLDVNFQVPDAYLISSASAKTRATGHGFLIYRVPKSGQHAWVPTELALTQIYEPGRAVGLLTGWNARWPSTTATVEYDDDVTPERLAVLRAHPCSALLARIAVAPDGRDALRDFIVNDDRAQGSCLHDIRGQ